MKSNQDMSTGHLYSVVSLFLESQYRMGEGHFGTHGKRASLWHMKIHTPISRVGFNSLAPASEVVIYTSTPGLQHIAVTLFMRLRWNLFSVGPVEKQVLLPSELPRGRGSAFRPDGGSFSTPQAPVQTTSWALSCRSAPADAGSQATNSPIRFSPE